MKRVGPQSAKPVKQVPTLPSRGIFGKEGQERYKLLVAQAESDEQRLARKLALAKISQKLLDKEGPSALPKRIELKRIRSESLAALPLFEEELDKARKRQQNKYGGDVILGDFIELIKDHLAKKGRRPKTTGELAKLPYFDWRLTGIVPRPRDQGLDCGSCWAHTATEAFESRLMYNINRVRVFNIREVTPVIQIGFSVQGVMDCVEDGGCEGGGHNDAFDHFVRNGARIFDFNEDGQPINDRSLATGNRGSCKEQGGKGIKALTWDFAIPRNPLLVPRGEASILKLKRALLDYGTLAVNVTTDPDKNFRDYREEKYPVGVYDIDCRMGANHNVLITGWDDCRGAWIILNSFGREWGGSCVDAAQVRRHFPWTLPNVRNLLKRERGCMYIKYGFSKVGQMAAWIETPVDNKEWMRKARRKKARIRVGKLVVS